MTDKTLERVCRILCEADERDPDATLSGDGVNFQWETFESTARLVIQAVREEDAK